MAALDFRGQTVWVTGAGKGIGYATALAFVEAGANVTGFDLAFDGESYPLPPKRWTSPMPTGTRGMQPAVGEHRAFRCAGERRRDPAHGRYRPAERGRLAADLRGQRRRAFNLFQQTMAQFRRQRGGAIVTVASDAAHTPRIGMSAMAPRRRR